MLLIIITTLWYSDPPIEFVVMCVHKKSSVFTCNVQQERIRHEMCAL